MTAQHTPGPWRAIAYYRSATDKGWVIENDTATIARVPVHPNQPANVAGLTAGLIAAAPELLAACREALFKLERIPQDKMIPVVNMLRAAIAKATGTEKER